MSSLTPIFITGYGKGLQKDKKPFLLPDQAWAVLENGYVWRESVREREGLDLIGRLRRDVNNGGPAPTLNQTTTAGTQTIITDVFSDPSINLRSSEPNAEIELPSNGVRSILFNVNAGVATWTDAVTPGILTPLSGISDVGTIDYVTGRAVLNFTVPTAAGQPIQTDFNYFPSLPGMGIPTREISNINDEQTIWFDTKYAYIWNGTNFQEFIPGTTWSGTDSDFFWSFNYQGATADDRLFFTTNFVNNSGSAIRYTDGSTWKDFSPIITDAPNPQRSLYQARILISYYGRLIALNTWEGLTGAGYAGAANFFNRARFSQLGSAIQADAWKTDIFGKGGAIDAPTNEAIIGAMFVKDTLLVLFEETTWQLRYVGEYGLPFIWERVSADFGSESTFSSVLFDNNMLAVGDTAIIGANAIGAQRIDLQIPDQVFDFKNANNGVLRIHGIRDYQRELVFWNFPDSNTMASPTEDLTYPNKVLVYNYRNNTWALFRDNITAFGNFRKTANVTWDSSDVFWDDELTTWDDTDNQSKFPEIVSVNQQGFVHAYGYVTPDEPSLAIKSIDVTVDPIVVTSPNHNLQTEEVIQITGMLFLDSDAKPNTLTSTLNGALYGIQILTKDTFSLLSWNFSSKQYENVGAQPSSFDPSTALADIVYSGGGQITLFPKLNVQTKDIDIYQSKGVGTKLSHIDFLMKVMPDSAMTVNLVLNTSPEDSENRKVGNKNMSTSLTPSFYPLASDYAWFRFFAGLSAQYFSINITYDESLMNTLTTHQQYWTLYAINAFCRPGGRTLL